MGKLDRREREILQDLGGFQDNLEEHERIQYTYITYRPFHKTLPRASAFVYWISVRFYESDCMYSPYHKTLLFYIYAMCASKRVRIS